MEDLALQNAIVDSGVYGGGDDDDHNGGDGDGDDGENRHKRTSTTSEADTIRTFVVGKVAKAMKCTKHQTTEQDFVVVVHSNVQPIPKAILAILTTASAANELGALVQADGTNCADLVVLLNAAISGRSAGHVPHSIVEHIKHITNWLSSQAIMHIVAIDLIMSDGARRRNRRHPRLVAPPVAMDAEDHLVGVSTTQTPTAKPNTIKISETEQVTMMKSIVRQLQHLLVDALKPSALRPPADPNLMLEDGVYASEVGKKKHGHGQYISIVRSKYAEIPIDRAAIAAARRAVGLTKVEREQKIRNARDKPTVDALEQYYRKAIFDSSTTTMKYKHNVFNLADREEMLTYVTKDLDEDHCLITSFTVQTDGVERKLTADELQSMCDRRRALNASSNRAYRKVLSQKHIYVNEVNLTQLMAHEAEKKRSVKVAAAWETHLNHGIADGRFKLDPKLRLMDIATPDALPLPVRLNMLSLVDSHPKLVEKYPNYIAHAWMNVQDSVQKYADRADVREIRDELKLPDLVKMHNMTSAAFRSGIRTGNLAGVSIGTPSRFSEGRALILDWANSLGHTDGASNTIESEHMQLRTETTNTVNNTVNTYVMAVFVVLLIRAERHWFEIARTRLYEAKQDAVADVMETLDLDYDEVAVDPSLLQLNAAAVDIYVKEKIDEKSHDSSNYLGVLNYDEFQMQFTDSMNMPTANMNNIPMHIAVVFDDTSGHAFVVVWQISSARNQRMLESHIASDSNSEGDYDMAVDNGDDAHTTENVNGDE